MRLQINIDKETYSDVKNNNVNVKKMDNILTAIKNGKPYLADDKQVVTLAEKFSEWLEDMAEEQDLDKDDVKEIIKRFLTY